MFHCICQCIFEPSVQGSLPADPPVPVAVWMCRVLTSPLCVPDELDRVAATSASQRLVQEKHTLQTAITSSQVVKQAVRLLSEEERAAKKRPSYVGISCSVSGYSQRSRYGALSQSRDSSPARGLRSLSRDSSPPGGAGGGPADGASVPTPSRVSLIKQQLRVGGRLTDERGRDGQRPAHRAEQSRSVSVDRGYLRRSRTEAARLLNGAGRPALNGSSPPPAPAQPTGEPTRAGTEDDAVPPSSFVQARIERLYGPGALCCRFRRVVNLNRSLPSRPAPLQLAVDTGGHVDAEREQTAPASPGLPVFRHLRPEFRQQLAVRGSRARPPPADTSPTQTAVPPITAADPPLLGHSAAPQQKPGHRFLEVGHTFVLYSGII